MPKLMVDVITSLDGFSSAESWPGLWGMGGPEYFAWLEQDATSTYTVLIGATTYRLFVGITESGEEDMDGLTALDKIVFSSTLEDPLTWANARLVSGDAVEVVRGMKQDGDTAMRTIGSLSLSGRCWPQAWWTASGSLSSRWSPERLAASLSMRGGPTSSSRRSTTARSTAGCR